MYRFVSGVGKQVVLFAKLAKSFAAFELPILIGSLINYRLGRLVSCSLEVHARVKPYANSVPFVL